MLDRLWRSAKIGLSGPPGAYRPGSLLQHLRADLAGFEFELLAPDRACVRALDLQLEAREVVEPQFLMHIVSTEFSCEYSTDAPGQPTVISARHRGAWRRTGVAFTCATIESHPLVARLAQCMSLQEALQTLDFTEWRLASTGYGWRLSVRLFGASEVVGHVPAFRRYVRLERAQCAALMTSTRAVGTLLGHVE